jgi:hypothetical protein
MTRSRRSGRRYVIDSSPTPDSLLLAAQDLALALANLGLTHTIIGGVAVSLLAQPRHTEDLDALIVFDTGAAESLLEVLAAHGFKARFRDMADLAIRARMVTVLHEASGTVVDIALGCMPFEEEVLQRSSPHQSSGVTVQLPTPEDLVVLKAAANRPKDREDIRTIARVYPKLDRKRIRYWVEQYGAVLDNPGLWREVEALLDSAPG